MRTFIITILLLCCSTSAAQFNVVLGEMQTSYAFKGEKASRAGNIELAASKINGVVIQPQQTFSYNQTVGNRTYENGFRDAPVIILGKLVEGIGGGVCQVSGTLHAAMFLSGMEIIESTQHSRKSTYIDAGLDSTVVWDYRDLRIKNNYPFPIKINVFINRDPKRGHLEIKIMGKEKIYYIEHKTIVHYMSKKLKKVFILNRNFKHGQRKVIEVGTPKMDITRIRRVYKINTKELVLQEDKRIVYDASNRVIEVAPK
jgi:vancomycin resistance protein YoaR